MDPMGYISFAGIKLDATHFGLGSNLMLSNLPKFSGNLPETSCSVWVGVMTHDPPLKVVVG